MATGAQWGYYTDRETRLELLTNRYYDPNAGRFVTRDPIGFNGGINLYSYVGNNPITRVDPLGLAVFYYWAPSGKSYGHAALMLDDGTYISYWPAYPCAYGLHGVQPFKACPVLKGNSFGRDVEDEGRRPDKKVRIEGLDEGAIKGWWNNGEGHGDWMWKNNCSDIVKEALDKGGFHIPGRTFGNYPDDVLNGIEEWGNDGAEPGSKKPRSMPQAGYTPYWNH